METKAEAAVTYNFSNDDLSLPGPLCPAHSEVSGWRCQSSAAGAAEHRLWADKPPLCRRSLTETTQKTEKKEWRKGKRVCVSVYMSVWSIYKEQNRDRPTAFEGRESSFRFSSHSWSCFFTLFIRDSCEVTHTNHRKCCLYSLHMWRLCVEEM